MMDHALRYAARGRNVFPVHWPRDGVCSCGRPDCSSPAKHPLTPHGLNDATTNPEQIQKWWAQWPDANIGIVTGQVSGIVVVDVDLEKDGIESWDQLCPTGWRVQILYSVTGSGGMHLYFQAPADELKSTAGTIAPGIDTRAEGGYVVAPPSLHISGQRYAWEPEGP